MTPPAPPAKRASCLERSRRQWSLLWLMPERTARRLSWLVVIVLGLLPLGFLCWQAWRMRSGAWERMTEKRLSDTLCAPVEFTRGRLVAPGYTEIRDIRIGATQGVIWLSAKEGALQDPMEAHPGRLILQKGKLSVDLDWWTNQTDAAIVESLLAQKALASISLKEFDATLRLDGRETTFSNLVGVATVSENSLDGSFAGRGDAGEMTLKLDLDAEKRRLSVSSDALPWVADLLRPTLGEPAADMLGRFGGTLELGPDLRTGTTEGATWRLSDIHGTLDLSRLPEVYGLEGVTGILNLTVTRAFGRLGGAATFEAKLESADGEGGTIPAAVIQRIHFLFTGREKPPLDRDARYESLQLHVVFTGDDLYVSGEVELIPSDGKEPREKVRMSFPGDGTRLKAFSRRLQELERRWFREKHTI